jgi:hypothetical protein
MARQPFSQEAAIEIKIKLSKGGTKEKETEHIVDEKPHPSSRKQIDNNLLNLIWLEKRKKPQRCSEAGGLIRLTIA